MSLPGERPEWRVIYPNGAHSCLRTWSETLEFLTMCHRRLDGGIVARGFRVQFDPEPPGYRAPYR